MTSFKVEKSFCAREGQTVYTVKLLDSKLLIANHESRYRALAILQDFIMDAVEARTQLAKMDDDIE